MPGRCRKRVIAVLVIGMASGIFMSPVGTVQSTVHAAVIAGNLEYPFRWPITGRYRGYGPGGGHEGYDLYGWGSATGHPGRAVVASHSGQVVEMRAPAQVTPGCNTSQPAGVYVVLDHGLYRTRYHHLTSISAGLAVGQWIGAGQVLGIEGATGNAGCTEMHLHIEFEDKASGNELAFTGDVPGPTDITAGGPIAFSGTWDLNASADGVTDKTVFFGLPGDVPIVGDWNGDGKDNIGIVRFDAAAGQLAWYISNQSVSATANNAALPVSSVYYWGVDGDMVVSGDWNGDNYDAAGIVRSIGSTTLQWWVTNYFPNPTLDYKTVAYGGNWWQNVPVEGDWNGDGIDTFATYHVPFAHWYYTDDSVSLSPAPSYAAAAWGYPVDWPFAGDWSTNNLDRAFVFQKPPSVYGSATWFRRPNLTSATGTTSFAWRTANDYPLLLDWDVLDILDDYASVR